MKRKPTPRAILLILISLMAATTVFGQHVITREVEGGGDGSQTKTMSADDVFFIGGVGALVIAGKDKLRVDFLPEASNRDAKYREVDLREGDVIMMVNGKRTKTIKKIKEAFDKVETEGEITLGIRRGKEMVMVSFPKSENSPGGGQMMIMTQEVDEGEAGEHGEVITKTMTFGSPDGGNAEIFPLMGFGVLLTNEEDNLKVMQKINIQGMKSEPVDLEPEDIILSINDEAVSAVADFANIYDNLKVGDQVSLAVQRGDKTIKVAFAKPSGMGGPNIKVERKSN